MSHCKLLFVFVLISSIFSINHVSALSMEEIIGGYPALQSEFPYYAAIVGKYSFNYHQHLLCSAGILNDFLLIAAARCFVHPHNEMKKFSFYAVVGMDVLLAKDIILREIYKIYSYRYSNGGFSNDLAITRLKESLNLLNCSNLIPLELPTEEESFHGETGLIAGYGVDSVRDLNKDPSRDIVRLNSKRGLFLKQANVTILSDGIFNQVHRIGSNIPPVCRQIVYPFVEICGIIPRDVMYKHRGMCKGDNGGPLVIGRKVVGIVSIHNYDCDDTKQGTIYTKVSNLLSFINGVISENYTDGTIFHDNNPYIHRKPIQTLVDTNG